jgi:tetratricopeptide (TPR) repeat protein
MRFGRDAEILQHRGWAFFFADAWKLARRDLDEAIRLEPRTHDAYLGRGLARVMLGDHRGAVADAAETRRQNRLTTPEQMHNLACIYALAAGRVKADAGERQRAELEASYRRQALEALRQTLPLIPRRERLAFWQEKMRPDPALDAIRDCAEFSRLDRDLKREYSAKPVKTKEALER